MPPEMGIAAVSSPKTAPTGTRKIAPKRNAIIAGTGPPPTTIQSPTCRTQPVPMMAPKPMVKKFQSESVFFMPPVSSTATSAFLSAIVPLLSFLTPLGVTPCTACFAAHFLFHGFKIRPWHSNATRSSTEGRTAKRAAPFLGRTARFAAHCCRPPDGRTFIERIERCF